jgi:ABC-type transport system substrate-binding protein
MRNLFLSAVICHTLFFLVSCNEREKNPYPEKVIPGGILKLAITESVSSLDPIKILFTTEWELSNLVFEGLVEYGSEFTKIVPVIAEKYESFDGGLRWRFYLRKNVKFHNDPCFSGGEGRQVTSSDILYTFKRIANPVSECYNWPLIQGRIEGIDDFYSGKSKEISGIKLLSDYEIEFKLTRPYSSFLKFLASPAAFIVPREAVEFYKENFGQHIVGTGPFRIGSWKPLREIFFVRNENYKLRQNKSGVPLPYLDEIRFYVLSTYSQVISEFLKGECNLIRLDKSSFNDLVSKENFSKNFSVHYVSEGMGTRFFGFKMDGESILSKDVNLRIAIAKSFNREALFNKESDSYRIANTLAPPVLLGDPQVNWYKYNPAESKKISESYQDFKNISVRIFSSISSPDAAQLTDDINSLGLNAKLVVESADYYGSISKLKPEIFRVSMSASYPDPDEYYMMFYSKTHPSINLCGYSNPDYDEIYERSLFEQDPIKRIKLFLEMEKILMKDVPVIYLSHEGPQIFVFPDYIKGFKTKFILPGYEYLWMDKSEMENDTK